MYSPVCVAEKPTYSYGVWAMTGPSRRFERTAVARSDVCCDACKKWAEGCLARHDRWRRRRLVILVWLVTVIRYSVFTSVRRDCRVGIHSKSVTLTRNGARG